jgi:hypothetical protein
MRILSLVLVLVMTASISCAQKSPRKQAEGTIGGTTVSVDYGAPSVKGRKVWGGLEKYDVVWRAGANENTTVSFDKEVKVAGQALAAGKYGLFIIPKESGDWVVIFSKQNDAWGAYSYSEAQDALRVSVSPEMVEDNQEELMYAVANDGILFGWEKVRLNIPVE